MDVQNSFYDFCDCLSDALDVLVGVIDGLNLYIGEIHVNFWWIFGAGLVFAIYNILLGYAEPQDYGVFESNYRSEEDW